MKITEKLTFLNETALTSLNTKSELEIIRKFTDAGILVLKGNFGFAWHRPDGHMHFELAYKSKRTPYTPQTPRKKGTNYKVFKSGEPLFVSNVGVEGGVRSDALSHMQSFASIPMTYQKKNYGNIVVCFFRSHTFSSEEKELCSYIGNAAAQAITIYRLHAGLKRAQKNLEKRVRERTRKLAESYTELAMDRAKDEAILTSIGEGLLATDKEGNVIFANPQAEQLLGWKKNEIIGTSLFDTQTLLDDKGQIVPIEQRPTYKTLTQGKRITTSAYSYLTKGKQIFNLSITVTPVILNNEIIGSIQVFRDISQEKEVDRVKSELISLASHQLRTPLSAINWYTEALVKEEIGPVTKDQKKYLQQIHHANQKMVELVYDFLNVSRIELGTFSTKLSTINVPELSQGILKEIAPLILQKKLKVKEFYGKRLANVEVDKKVLRLILQNLVTNAVKYTPSKGCIEIRIEFHEKNSGKGSLVISVADNGYGIPKHQQSKIFTKLFRADNAAKLDTEGSGLGLYLVKSFVDFSKGKISFTSKENEGSTFYVSLPVNVAEAVDKQIDN